MQASVKAIIVLCLVTASVLGIVSLAPGGTSRDPAHSERTMLGSEILLRKRSGGTTGLSTATFELVGDASSLPNALAIFRLVFINPDNGLLAEVSRHERLDRVVWPARLTNTAASGQTTTATFSVSTAALNESSAIESGLQIVVTE